jgi:hypothetical protein
MYQGGGRPAAASYKSYLTSDAAAAARADGYGLREWRHDSSGALWSVSSGLLAVDTPAVLTCQMLQHTEAERGWQGSLSQSACCCNLHDRR